MTDISVARADARLIAEAASDCADKALEWKDRALTAEAILAHFVDWVAKADSPDDDAQYLNGEHPEQRAIDRNGWDDIREIAADARQCLEGGSIVTAWPWMHREGHMKAKIVEETAESVTYDFQHVRIDFWKGRSESSKAMFNRAFALSPANKTQAAEVGL